MITVALANARRRTPHSDPDLDLEIQSLAPTIGFGTCCRRWTRRDEVFEPATSCEVEQKVSDAEVKHPC